MALNKNSIVLAPPGASKDKSAQSIERRALPNFLQTAKRRKGAGTIHVHCT
jgi:hypothetical protein